MLETNGAYVTNVKTNIRYMEKCWQHKKGFVQFYSIPKHKANCLTIFFYYIY
jgi:hypothetical protein